MPTKYLTLDEAAARLGIPRERLIRLREQGEIRGFADRGTWKFRPEDVEKLREKLEESPDLGTTAGELDDFEKTVVEEPAETFDRLDSDPEVRLAVDSDSDVSLVGEEEEDSDSDVKLTEKDSDSDVTLVPEDSDSDVRLATEETVAEIEMSSEDSDSDVALVDSDSDVRLVDETIPIVEETGKEEDSDSDVALVETDKEEETDSDSDVRLTEEAAPVVDVGSDSDVRLVGLDSDSDVRLATDDEVSASQAEVKEEKVPESDSDIGLLEGEETTVFSRDDVSEEEEESGIALATESGISLDQPVDSGISLEEEDSGITLEIADESGIALEEADESGISLESEPELKVEPSDETETIPILSQQGSEDEEIDETVFDVPSLEDEDTSFELQETSDTEAESIPLFDEEELEEAVSSDQAATAAEEPTFEFDLEEDTEAAVLEGAEPDLDVDVDVFSPEEADFEGAFETGESQPEFVASAAVGLGRTRMMAEPEWGLSVFIPLAIGSVLICLCGAVMYDMVRSIWGWHAVSAFNSPLLDFLAGLLK